MKYGKIPNPPKSANTSILGSYKAVWPDPMHAKCSYGHFKMFQRQGLVNRIVNEGHHAHEN